MWISKARKVFDWVYIRNRILYILAENPPISDDFNNDAISSINSTRTRSRTRWNFQRRTSSRSNFVKKNPDVNGLIVCPHFFQDKEVSTLRDLLSSMGDWYEYHPGREMYAMQPYPCVDEKMLPLLKTLESQNKTNPQEWPKISDFKKLSPIVRLQEFLESGEFTPNAKSQSCLFVQVQRVERGISVGSHKDDLRKGGRVICTAVLEGENYVRVGDVEFRVQPGDVYALCDEARFDVDHEVLPDTSDRLSVTLRFGLVSEDEVEKRDTLPI